MARSEMRQFFYAPGGGKKEKRKGEKGKKKEKEKGKGKKGRGKEEKWWSESEIVGAGNGE